MKILYLDESGDHSLEKIDPQYPVFVLGGVIIDESYAKTSLAAKLSALKMDVFGNPNLVLHTADIARNKNGFESLKQAELRKRFYEQVNELMENLEYKVVACVIKKSEHLGKYGLNAVDPYLLGLEVVVERFCFEVGDGEGCVVAEMRGNPLDKQLMLAWSQLLLTGTRFLSASTLKKRVPELILKPKRDNIPGLQIADLIVSPIGRYVLGKPAKQDWDIVESKFRRSFSGTYLGHGLVILPKDE